MKSHAPKFVYVINEAIVRFKRRYVLTTGVSNLTKIDALMICHKYDTVCLYLSIQASHEIKSSKEDPPIIKQTLKKF